MQYISLIYEYAGSVEKLSEAQLEPLVDQHRKLQERAKEEGAYLGASELKSAGTAISVRIRNGAASVIDGPFAESKELFVGFYLFDCSDLDAALRWAGMIPTASNCGVEIRPVDQINCQAEGVPFPVSLDDKSLFALLNYLDEDLLEAYTDQDVAELIKENSAMAERARSCGDYVGGNKLMPAATATTIDHGDKGRRIMDGPFCEAKEILLGLHVVACNSMEEAIDYAKTIPDARAGVVEVRPINFHEQEGQQALRWNSSV